MDKETLERHLKTMTIPELQSFAAEAMQTYGSEEKLEEANKVIDFLKAYYTKKKILTPQTNPYFMELMETAAFIHNLFTDDTWISVYKAREILMPLVKGVDPKNVENLFSIVEGQLGEDMPVPGSRPPANNPIGDFALACWVVKQYNK